MSGKIVTVKDVTSATIKLESDGNLFSFKGTGEYERPDQSYPEIEIEGELDVKSQLDFFDFPTKFKLSLLDRKLEIAFFNSRGEHSTFNGKANNNDQIMINGEGEWRKL